jgi:hypothetical protein
MVHKPIQTSQTNKDSNQLRGVDGRLRWDIHVLIKRHRDNLDRLNRLRIYVLLDRILYNDVFWIGAFYHILKYILTSLTMSTNRFWMLDMVSMRMVYRLSLRNRLLDLRFVGWRRNRMRWLKQLKARDHAWF